LGWATITHPFHPQRGQRFAILKTRRVSGVDTLILHSEGRGPNSVPREWTDRADLSPYASLAAGELVFDFRHLLELADLLGALETRGQELDK
jgi:hypothetical protein